MRNIVKTLFVFAVVLLLAGSALAAVDEAKLFKMIDSNDVKGLRAAIAGGLDLNKEYSNPDFWSNSRKPMVIPLMPYAVLRRKPDIVRLLIGQGANPDVLWRGEMLHETSLMCAVSQLGPKEDTWRSNLAIIRMLLAAGANVNVESREMSGVGESGWTALHYAAVIPNVDKAMEVCRLLVEHGADVNAKTESGITPLDVVTYEKGNRTYLIKYLKDHGAKYNLYYVP